MKTVHILQTDKPSRLACDFDKLILNSRLLSPILYKTQHIYITSNEEIKEGFVLLPNNEIVKLPKASTIPLNNFLRGYSLSDCKKIILTIDQSLIKDGVQSIDDEFLEWFVKNPSCEEVEVKLENYYASGALQPNLWQHKIIIPKEEPEQHVELINDNIEEFDKAIELFKQETTLEEAAERISPIQQVINFITENFQKEGEPRQLTVDLLKKWCEVKLLNEESKWQQERSYSEEEVLKLILTSSKLPFANDEERIDWFEQFKKK